MNNKNQNLPKGWVVVKLEDIVLFQKGKKPKNVSPEKNENYQIPYINIKAFEKNIIDEYTDGVDCVFCENDDLVMVWDGARAGYVGKSIKGALGSTLMKLSFPEILKNYAYYFLSSKFLQINTNAKGTGIPHVNPDLLWNFDFPLPPLSEQHRIVAKIEELFSSLDKAVERLKATREQLKIYRQAVLKWAFEGRFTHKDIKQGELPKGWKSLALGEIISIRSGEGLTSSKRDNKGNFLVYGGNGVTGSHNEYLYEEEKIIIGRVGAHCGNVHITKPKSWVTDNAFVVTFDKKNINLKFLYYLLKVSNLNNYSSSTAQPVISQTKIYPIIVKFPKNKSEQQQIVSEIEKRLSVAEKVEESIRVALEKAERLRQSILKKAFEGKLVPQDPNDEPASVLLEKIKAEKKQHRKQK